MEKTRVEKLIDNLAEELTKDITEKMDEIADALEEASKEDYTITSKQENGVASLSLTGSGLAILVGLAGIVNTVLNQYDVPDSVFETIRHSMTSKIISSEETEVL